MDIPFKGMDIIEYNDLAINFLERLCSSMHTEVTSGQQKRINEINNKVVTYWLNQTTRIKKIRRSFREAATLNAQCELASDIKKFCLDLNIGEEVLKDKIMRGC